MSGEPRDQLARFLHDTVRRAEDEREDVAYEQVEAYVDGRLGDVDREIVESRLADDPVLGADVEELRALRGAMAAPVVSAVTPVVAFPAPRAMPAPAPRDGFVRRWALPAGLAAAAVLAVFVWRDTRPGPVVPQQAQQPSAPRTAPPRPPAPGAAPVVAGLLDHGRTIGISPEGTLSGLDGVPSEVALAVTQTLRDGRLPASPLARQVDTRAGRLMGSGAERASFVPIAPLGTAVASARPTFSWTPLPGATSYRVRIVDQDLRPVTEGVAVTTPTWRPAASLPAGRVLLWQVEAETPAGLQTTPVPPLPEARVVVLPPTEARRVAEAIAAIGDSDLAAAVVYAAAGLNPEAEAALARVVAANPGSTLARGLQADLAMRRRGLPRAAR